MNLIDSYKRWKKIILSLKKVNRRFELLESNIENIVNEFHNDQKTNQNYKAFLRSKEYQIYSQNGEDGLLLYIFSEIGTTNRKAIEFGIGDGKQCNLANLIINFGWQTLMIDGNANGVSKAKKYYKDHPNCSDSKVIILNEFITKENINALFTNNGFNGEIDLLSIDIDGNDYWIWQAIHSVNPRVVVIEYNASLGIDKSVSVEYDKSFYRYDKHKSGWYHGASLVALQKLGLEKGYNLIGCDSNGVNAFFIRNDIQLNKLTSVSPQEVYYTEKKRSQTHTQKEQFDIVKHLPFSEI
ncbi:MAG: hypothetical protein RLN81_13425 [Balneolaceae bacterium]